jgi:hypothetical protein
MLIRQILECDRCQVFVDNGVSPAQEFGNGVVAAARLDYAMQHIENFRCRYLFRGSS